MKVNDQTNFSYFRLLLCKSSAVYIQSVMFVHDISFYKGSVNIWLFKYNHIKHLFCLDLYKYVEGMMKRSMETEVKKEGKREKKRK